ncbi:MAG: hypothetical protein ACREUA_08330 [Burkholderiales bacterium]
MAAVKGAQPLAQFAERFDVGGFNSQVRRLLGEEYLVWCFESKHFVRSIIQFADCMAKLIFGDRAEVELVGG